MSNANQFRHNGKFARKSIVNWKNNVSKSAKKLHEKYKNVGVQLPSNRRIVDLEKLATEMWCMTCDLPLSFRFLIQEEIFGAASVFHLKCPKCDRIRQVKSSTSEGESTRSRYHVNFKLALTILDGGIGETQLNTILSALNLPTVNHNLIKRYERLVGPAVEVVAKENCHEALKVERELTILNEGSCDRTSTEKTLHDGDSEINLNSGASDTKTGDSDLKAVSTTTIINPMAERIINTVQTDIMVDTNNNNVAETDFEETNKCCDDSTFDVGSAAINSTGSFIHDESNSKESFASSSQELPKNRKRKLQSIIGSSKTPKTRVGLRLSYDGAWLKKGSGRCYNSKQGHGTAFGHYSRKCVAYATRNKGCRYCRINSKKKHDCRSNFVGSSKAMEADIAVQILTQNETFVEENVEIKTLIAGTLIAGRVSMYCDRFYGYINFFKKAFK
ncbi:hypothetical protein KQX54_013714 [Cotesia glomerata]|uniref:Mutator-like transposase domain-containing protein n=1 Tax=Cotesia glomerata TaxID=32391 RepID=A0AAV7I996_COTGL|nr:hypothetical protein KQX54_013714 [Cotesia glomerata]